MCAIISINVEKEFKMASLNPNFNLIQSLLEVSSGQSY